MTKSKTFRPEDEKKKQESFMWRERIISNREKESPKLYNFWMALARQPINIVLDSHEYSFRNISSFTSAVCRMTLSTHPPASGVAAHEEIRLS